MWRHVVCRYKYIQTQAILESPLLGPEDIDLKFGDQDQVMFLQFANRVLISMQFANAVANALYPVTLQME